MNNIDRLKNALDRKSDRIMTYDYLDNTPILRKYGGYDDTKKYTFEELVELNAKAWHGIGVDITRSVHDPVNHWMPGKIANWIRFFGVDPSNWSAEQGGETAWISKRPFHDLAGLEKNLPNLPEREAVKEWFKPHFQYIQEVYAHYDVAYIGCVEGPITDAYTYTEMELFAKLIYDAPELLSHIMDCTGRFSGYIAEAFAEVTKVPLMFMGEDIASNSGPIFSPKFVRAEGLPRWHWIMDPVQSAGCKFIFHTDGRYGKFLPMIFDELGADCLNPIERNGCNNIFEIQAQYPDKLFFGNVCCMNTLPHGTPADVEDETLELIQKIGPQRAIFIGSSSEVHNHVPVENAEVMYKSVHDYGVYPIDTDALIKRRNVLRRQGNLRLRKDSPIH